MGDLFQDRVDEKRAVLAKTGENNDQPNAQFKVGDEVSVYCEVERVGRTSLTIAAEAWRRERHSEEETKVTEAKFTFVAVDESGRPRVIEP